MSFPTHIIKVNNRFYYKIRVPVDLRQHFPCDFIKKSLKTDELQSAKILLVSISHVEKRIKNTPPFLELDGSDAKGLVGTDGE